MNHKCVIVLKTGLPPGFAANAAAVLAISLGKKHPEIVADDFPDASGGLHAGLVNVPVPLLQSDDVGLKSLRNDAISNPEVTVVDFSEPARVAKTMESYRDLLKARKPEDLSYVGVALFGPKKAVSDLTAGLSLLR